MSFSLSDLEFVVVDSGTINYSKNHTNQMCNPQREFILDQWDKRVNVCTVQGRVRVDTDQTVS